MNIQEPHNIVDDIEKAAPEDRKNYVPVTETAAEILRGMAPDERAKWLRNPRRHGLTGVQQFERLEPERQEQFENAFPLDMQRIRRAQAKRDRKNQK